MFDNVSIMFLFQTQNEVLISCIEAQLPLLSPVTTKNQALRDILSPSKTWLSFMSTFYHLACSVHLLAQREDMIKIEHYLLTVRQHLACSSELNGWIWIVVKNTHKCFLINHMEGKLAKHSVFFPIIEFLHLKSLNSNSQQFHVVVKIWNINCNWQISQSGWMTFYYFTVLLSLHNTLLLISYPAWLDVF